jgi:hypothetical protein
MGGLPLLGRGRRPKLEDPRGLLIERVAHPGAAHLKGLGAIALFDNFHPRGHLHNAWMLLGREAEGCWTIGQGLMNLGRKITVLIGEQGLIKSLTAGGRGVGLVLAHVGLHANQDRKVENGIYPKQAQ